MWYRIKNEKEEEVCGRCGVTRPFPSNCGQHDVQSINRRELSTWGELKWVASFSHQHFHSPGKLWGKCGDVESVLGLR